MPDDSAPLDAVTALAALAHATRWRAMQMMADGSSLTTAQLARAVGMELDGVGKHLLVLRRAGLVDAYAGADARFTEYSIPKRFLLPGNMVDFGFAQLRF